MKRKKFLQTACPLIGLGIVDLGLLAACTKEGAQESPPVEVIPVEEQEYLDIKAQLGAENALEIDGNLYLNLSHSNYTELDTIEGFVNDLNERVLLVRSNETTVLAFDNCCPHRGTRNQWTYSNSSFQCNNHGNSFGIEENDTAFCNSNREDGNLLQYSTSLYKDLLKISFD